MSEGVGEARPRRRSEDHPWETPARVVLGTLFGAAAIWFAHLEAHVPMAVFLVACGAMFKIDMGRWVSKVVGGRAG